MPRQALPSVYQVPVFSRPYVPQEVIKFSAYGEGLPIIALKNMSVEIAGGADYILQGARPISLRTLWPGYSNVLASTHPRIIETNKLTRAELASKVALNVIYFFDHVRRNKILCADDSFYAITEKGFTMQNIYLEGIVNTGGNWWQPIILIEHEGDPNEALWNAALSNFRN